MSFSSLAKMLPDKSQCLVPGVPQDPIHAGDYSFNTKEVRSLSSYDYFTFVALLVTSTSIGVFVAWKSKKNLCLDDYLMAGRNENVFVAGLSRASSFISSLFIISCPLEIYTHSSNWIWLCLTFTIINLTAAKCFIPVFYRLKLTSLHEYLELRFSRGIRSVAAAMFVMHSIIYSAPVIFLPSLTLNRVVGFDLWYSIVAIAIVATVYSTVGGTKAVLWADAFQMCIMILGMLIMVIRMQIKIGSLQDVFESAARTNRLKLVDFSADLKLRNTMFSLTIGALGNYLPLYTANHTMVHRCLICKTLRDAKRAIWINLAVLWFVISFTVYVGLYMGYLYENCDPITAGLVKTPLELTPLFMLDVTHGVIGLMGVFMAYVFSASLSTISSGINSASTVAMEDFVRIYFSPNIRPEKAKRISQGLCLFFGMITLELTHLFITVESILASTFLVSGALVLPLLGCISLGLFFPQANSYGAYTTLFSGFLVQVSYLVGQKFAVTFKEDIVPPMCVSNCNISVLSNATLEKLMKPPSPIATKPEPNYFLSLSFNWIPFFTLMICLSLGIIVSYITGFQDGKDADARLHVPLADVVFPFYYLPERFRERLRCGVKYTDQWKRVQPAHTMTMTTEAIDAVDVPNTFIGKSAIDIKDGNAEEEEDIKETVDNDNISSGSTL